MSTPATTTVGTTVDRDAGASHNASTQQAIARRVAKFARADRWFERTTLGFAALVLLALVGLLASLIVQAWPALREFGPGDLYDGTAFSKAPRVNVPVPLTRLEFLRRFTPQQRISIRASNDPVIQDGMGLLDLAQEVRVDDPDTVFFVGYLVQQNLITQADADRILGVTP